MGLADLFEFLHLPSRSTPQPALPQSGPLPSSFCWVLVGLVMILPVGYLRLVMSLLQKPQLLGTPPSLDPFGPKLGGGWGIYLVLFHRLSCHIQWQEDGIQKLAPWQIPDTEEWLCHENGHQQAYIRVLLQSCWFRKSISNKIPRWFRCTSYSLRSIVFKFSRWGAQKR